MCGKIIHLTSREWVNHKETQNISLIYHGWKNREIYRIGSRMAGDTTVIPPMGGCF